MRFDSANRGTGWLGAVLYSILQPGQSEAATGWRLGQLGRQGLAVVLSALMILVPMGQANAFAQDAPPGVDQSAPPPADNGQQPPQAQPLAPDQLDQLVAPVALYPDNLVAQVLAASTYPTQVVEANRWLKEQGNAPAAQVASGANGQNWDASVKALTAFPQVLAQMDKNLQWTTDLGNAYYNQPQDVMDAVQAMRQKAQSAGKLQSSQQLAVNNNNGEIDIAPANPAVVYVPTYDPWAFWGIAPYPGFYYYPPPGIFFGGFGIGFGIGIGIGLWGGFGWGWGHWGMGWRGGYGGFRGVMFNHGGYYSRSSTVINRGFNRPGGPGRGVGARGAFARSGGGFNRGGGAGFNRAGGGVNRGGAGFNRGAAGASRSGGSFAGRTGATTGRTAGSFNGAARSSSVSRGASSGGGRSFSGGHAGGGGGGHVGGGGGHGGGGGGGHHGR